MAAVGIYQDPWRQRDYTNMWTTTASTTVNQTLWYNWVQTSTTTTGFIWNNNDAIQMEYGYYGTNTIKYNWHKDDAVWNNWNGTYQTVKETEQQQHDRVIASLNYREGNSLYAHDLEVLTVEERQTWEDMRQRREEERLAREREAAVVAEAERERRVDAHRRAELLLISMLDASQKREWLEKKWVTEVAPSGRVYRLHPVWSGGVTIHEEGSEVRRATLCVHPREYVPECDAMVANMLSIRDDEERFLKIAILHQGDWSEEERAIRAGRPVNIHENENRRAA